MQTSSFINYLVNKNLLTSDSAQTSTTCAQQQQVGIISYLIKNNSIEHQILADNIADYFTMDKIDLQKIDTQQLPISIISHKLIKQHNILPITLNDNCITIAISDPTQTNIIKQIRFHTNKEIKLLIAAHDQLITAIDRALNQRQYQELNHEDSEIIKLVDHILSDAINKQASDIHFEPYQNNFRIRFRIDGILHSIINPDQMLINRITTRLKIMANLDISERRLPQDGRFTAKINNEDRDCRINSCPTLFGEKIVIRILTTNNSELDLEQLGLTTEQLTLLTQTLKLTQGMVLVTGPTGSGKTISLYTALNQLNSNEKNISTAEDPIEINLPGVNQVAINTKIGLDFATTLRAFLRQDPDIIMVGEIRDQETAEIAIKAAQTGHLVLSTLHTNNTIETITRLINMGIARYNLIGSLSLVIAQRLVRKLCPHCKKLHNYNNDFLEANGINMTNNPQLYTSVGCKQCNQGYINRTGIFELLPINNQIKDMILQQNYAAKLTAHVKLTNITTLRQAALQRVCQGITSIEEINRVIN